MYLPACQCNGQCHHLSCSDSTTLPSTSVLSIRRWEFTTSSRSNTESTIVSSSALPIAVSTRASSVQSALVACSALRQSGRQAACTGVISAGGTRTHCDAGTTAYSLYPPPFAIAHTVSSNRNVSTAPPSATIFPATSQPGSGEWPGWWVRLQPAALQHIRLGDGTSVDVQHDISPSEFRVRPTASVAPSAPAPPVCRRCPPSGCALLAASRAGPPRSAGPAWR